MLKLDPDRAADFWQHKKTVLDSGEWETWQRPARGHVSEHVRHLELQSAAVLDVHVVEHHSAILPIICFPRAQGTTTGANATWAFRVSEKLCLYSPCLMLCVTLLTK